MQKEFPQFYANFNLYFSHKAGLSEEDLCNLKSYFQHKRIKKGTFLLREGEVCGHAFFVEKGLLRSYSIDDAGKEHIIQFAPENWIISDRSSSYFNEPSDFFIDAIEDADVIELKMEFLTQANNVSEAFRSYHERLIQNHVRHLQKRINNLLSASAEARYLEFIKMYPDLLLRVPQWMIASYLGITPESLSRVRKELALKNFKTA